MSVLFWHNPRCSKSRATLALLKERGYAPEVRLYLQDPPDIDELYAVIDCLKGSAQDIVRRGEPEYKAAGLSPESDVARIVSAMAERPNLIERPIVFANGMAKIGRPPEAVLEIL